MKRLTPGRASLTGRSFSEYGARTLGCLREGSEDGPDRLLGLDQELFDGKSLVDRWVEGEAWLHIYVRLRPGLLDEDPREFCAWLKNPLSVAWRDVAVGAIGGAVDKELRANGGGDHGLKPPVLVEPRQLVKNEEGLTVQVPLPSEVWLVVPNRCPVCSPDSGDLLIEHFAIVAGVGPADGKPHLPLIPGRERPDLTAPLVERPGDVIERRAQIVDDSPDAESPLVREERIEDRLHADDDAVTLRLVLLGKRDPELQVRVTHKGVYLAPQVIKLDYRPSPLQPGALEGIHRES